MPRPKSHKTLISPNIFKEAIRGADLVELRKTLEQQPNFNLEVADLQHPHIWERPIHIAARLGHLAMIKFLVEETCVKVHLRDCQGLTALHSAVRAERLGIVRYLVETVNSQVNTRDLKGQTPLHTACYQGSFDLVKYLLNETKAQLNPKDRHSRTPLDLSKERRNIEIAYLLILHGANENLPES